MRAILGLDIYHFGVGMLGTTFDYLGEQTARVAQLGPAVEASHQIHQLRRQVHAQGGCLV